MPELTTRATKGSALTHAELDANFKRTVTQKTTTYACLVSDNRSVIEGNHASTPFTITLGDATTMVAGDTGDYEVTITNVGAAVVTVARAGSDTIDGAATSLTLGQYDTVTLQVNSAGDGYLSTAGKIPGLTSTVAELNILDGVTSTASELNILDGVTSTAAELNILDGVTATATELNYSDGVTSGIQGQLNVKYGSGDTPTFGTVTLANGSGISYAATVNGSGTMTSELLDDYEEGTWTPTVQDASGSDAEGQGYDNQEGKYTKIGNLVTVYGFLNLNALGTLAGALRIAGLPYTSASDLPYGGGTFIGATLLNITAGHSVTLRTVPDDTRMDIMVWDDAGGSTGMTPAEMSSDADFQFTATYMV